MMHLQKLTYQGGDGHKNSDFVTECVLRYMIGNLFINFSLVWEPMTKVILTYAAEENDTTNLFWRVWMEILNGAVDKCG